jgi:transcriptional regulator with XRE-family HTH domain
MHTRGVIATTKLSGTLALQPRDGGGAASIPVQLAFGLRSLTLVDDDAEMQRRFAYALRAAMAQKGWKAPDLAKAIKRDASTVSRWIDEKSLPNILVTKQLAGALGVRPEFLFDPPQVPEYPLREYLIPQADAERAVDLARGAIELAREDLEREGEERQAAARSGAARRGKRTA